MADNVTLGAAVGVVAADEVADATLGTSKVQYVKLMDGTINGTDKAIVSTSGLRTDMGSKLAGEDLVSDVIKVEQRYTPFAISTATTTTVKSGSGFVHIIRIVGGTMGNVTIYDNTAASGTVLLPTVTAVNGIIVLDDVTFTTGLTIVTAAATVITGSYR